MYIYRDRDRDRGSAKAVITVPANIQPTPCQLRTRLGRGTDWRNNHTSDSTVLNRIQRMIQCNVRNLIPGFYESNLT